MSRSKIVVVSLCMAALCISGQSLAQTVVTKTAWIESMKSILPNYFCDQAQYFRQCFDVDTEQCLAVMTEKSEQCLERSQAQIPDSLNQPKDGTAWGQVVGSCTGQAYEIALLAKRVRNAKCNNPNNWR